jgi:hypothetical protein
MSMRSGDIRVRDPARAAAILIAALLLGCGGDDFDCRLPTSAGSSGTLSSGLETCTIAFEDAGKKQCYRGDQYKLDCVLIGDNYMCECRKNGATVKRCQNHEICRPLGGFLSDPRIIAYAETCCEWTIPRGN